MKPWMREALEEVGREAAHLLGFVVLMCGPPTAAYGVATLALGYPADNDTFAACLWGWVGVILALTLGEMGWRAVTLRRARRRSALDPTATEGR